MNIAIHNAQFSYHIGGTERLIYYQIKYLLNNPDINLTLITKKTDNSSFLFSEIKNLKKINLKIIEIDTRDSNNKYDSNNSLRWHIESLNFGLTAQLIYVKMKFDLVITHFSTDSLFIPKNQTNILHLHGVPLSYSEIGEISTRRPDYFIAVSNYVRDTWLKLYPSINKNKVCIVHPGIDSKKFLRKPSEKLFDIIFIGRFISIKGIENLIDAISLIKKPLKVCLIGNGPDKDIIIRKINNLGLKDIFYIFSDLNDEDLVKFYNMAKIAVFPSYAKEGVLLTMLEAASCGLSIITSNSCSMPEFLKDRKNGLLFEPRNSVELAERILELLSDDKLRLRLGNNAEKDIKSKWDNKIRVKEIYEVYKKFYYKNARKIKF